MYASASQVAPCSGRTSDSPKTSASSIRIAAPTAIPTALTLTGWTGGKRRTRTVASAKQSTAASTASNESAGKDSRPEDAGDHSDTCEGEQRACDRGEAHALLALERGEQERRQRDERQDRLAEARVDAVERVVGEAERAAEDQRAVEARAQQRATTRQREPQQCDHRAEEAAREQEAKPGAPERIELAVADPHADGVPSREHRTDDEGCERPAVAVAAHGLVSSETVSTCGVCGNMSTGFVLTSS